MDNFGSIRYYTITNFRNRRGRRPSIIVGAGYVADLCKKLSFILRPNLHPSSGRTASWRLRPYVTSFHTNPLLVFPQNVVSAFLFRVFTKKYVVWTFLSFQPFRVGARDAYRLFEFGSSCTCTVLIFICECILRDRAIVLCLKKCMVKPFDLD